MLNSSNHWLVPCSNIGDPLDIPHQPMVAIPQTQYFGSASVQPGNHQGEVISLCSRVNQEHLIEARTQLLAQHFGVLSLVLIHIDGRDVGESIDLFLHNTGYPGMGVAHRYSADTGDQIEVPLSLVVPQVLHVSLMDK